MFTIALADGACPPHVVYKILFRSAVKTVKYLKWSIKLTANCFHKTSHCRCLTGFSIRFCSFPKIYLPLPLSVLTSIITLLRALLAWGLWLSKKISFLCCMFIESLHRIYLIFYTFFIIISTATKSWLQLHCTNYLGILDWNFVFITK